MVRELRKRSVDELDTAAIDERPVALDGDENCPTAVIGNPDAQ
jgi:hypothetical protein